MIYLLDTNVCARYLNGKSLAIRQRLRSTNLADIAVCSVVKGELFYGAMKSNNLEKTLDRQQEFLKLFISLPFDDDASFIYGRIRAELSAKGIIIGANDLQIAAIAMVNNLILVTHNVREFSRVNGLRFDDWEV
ncbi:type II toxin-antitoxin system VapC family toxin [Dolichospermum planctonicum CS-1226]|jgi:tRNA(fMet)-specific endonuclease VapC|uniref:Ribonuclease VapC n=1 Tax=Dolichospermum planctonicum CS-1226 TaxID=3021751 RepID=A0ABT5ACE1_9CYAN|nr:type II toxin-antitoxin system VapC family toxin [Dolichospermum planctonicum]MDB9534938.1 type II toxin-antitoxin system VapC family toxin [Dolichospermum planctonicum CS-1226]